MPPMREPARLRRPATREKEPTGVSLSGIPTTTIVPSRLSRSKYWFQSSSAETVFIIKSKYPLSFSNVLGSDVA